MAGSVKYCPVQGLFLNCGDCKTLECMDFFLYVIEDAKTSEDVNTIMVTLEKLLINQIKTTIIVDSFGSKLIESLKGRYDYIIAQNLHDKRMVTALNLLLKQRKRGILIIDNVISKEQVNDEINRLFREGHDKRYFNSVSSLQIKLT